MVAQGDEEPHARTLPPLPSRPFRPAVGASRWVNSTPVRHPPVHAASRTYGWQRLLAHSARRGDGLVEPKEIRGIVRRFHGREPRVFGRTVGRLAPAPVVLRLVIDI